MDARSSPAHSRLCLLSRTLLAAACLHAFFLLLHHQQVAAASDQQKIKGAAFTSCSTTAHFPALFCFGTSLSDTGNGILSSPFFFPGRHHPYGSTFFGTPTGRFSDGRIMIDFVAQAIGLPFLKPYLSKRWKGTDFSGGVNYAVAGATVQESRELLRQGDITFLTRYSLDVQLQWHLLVKEAAQQTASSPPLIPDVLLPSPASFSEALYFIELGGNDYGTSFLSRHILPIQNKQPINNTNIINHVIPAVIDKMVQSIELLYANEARNFLVLNIFPEGCAPLFLKLLIGDKDALGCLIAVNEVNRIHNQQLLLALKGLSLKFLDIHLMYADVATAYNSVLQEPAKYGVTEIIKACCGAGPQMPYQFALSKICGPSSFKCEDPSSYVIWDGIHNTDAMNNRIVTTLTSNENLICLRSQ